MTRTNRRIHTINVRLSEEEYATLKTVCYLSGARSVSDLTRKAVNSLLRSATNPESTSEINLEEFRLSMKILESRLADLEAKLSSTTEEPREIQSAAV